jgi:protein TonB
MFRNALLESSPAMRRRNGWPMATAFTLEIAVASGLVLISLISTRVLPQSRIVVPVPPLSTPIETHQPVTTTSASGNALNAPNHQVVAISDSKSRIHNPFATSTPGDTPDQSLDPHFTWATGAGTKIPMIGNTILPPPVKPPAWVTSHSLEAMLIKKVIPDYPMIAKIAGVQGDVLLHAIVAKDGTIQSLTVTSGPDLLRKAALQAVQQWRYRPYMLNGEAIEVESIITVSFRRF